LECHVAPLTERRPRGDADDFGTVSGGCTRAVKWSATKNRARRARRIDTRRRHRSTTRRHRARGAGDDARPRASAAGGGPGLGPGPGDRASSALTRSPDGRAAGGVRARGPRAGRSVERPTWAGEGRPGQSGLPHLSRPSCHGGHSSCRLPEGSRRALAGASDRGPRRCPVTRIRRRSAAGGRGPTARPAGRKPKPGRDFEPRASLRHQARAPRASWPAPPAE
jgi:hypothetical protein